MSLITKIVIAFVALEHLYILWLEMFAMFFLGCVMAAGLYGASVQRSIFFVQALPAAIAFAAILIF